MYEAKKNTREKKKLIEMIWNKNRNEDILWCKMNYVKHGRVAVSSCVHISRAASLSTVAVLLIQRSLTCLNWGEAGGERGVWLASIF